LTFIFYILYLIDVESMVETDDTDTQQDLVKAAMDQMEKKIELYKCENVTKTAEAPREKDTAQKTQQVAEAQRKAPEQNKTDLNLIK
jgi:hypothetical protein